jgi:molybdate transport system substrate-binding protein
MRRRSFLVAIVSAFACIARATDARADELRVLSAVGMRQVLVELADQFERASGHKLLITFDSGAMIVHRIERGETADVLLVPHDAAQQLALARKAVASSITELASSRVGLAVRAGARRPDISSPEALKQALLMARAIARPDPAQGGSSGLHIQKVLERLGIADVVAAKTILSSRPDREDEMPANRVARGDAEIALHQIQELRAVPGVAVVGPFPGDLDGKFLFSAVLVSGTARQKAGEQLIAFLIAPNAKAVMTNRGMEPFSAPR